MKFFCQPSFTQLFFLPFKAFEESEKLIVKKFLFYRRRSCRMHSWAARLESARSWNAWSGK